MIKSPLLKKLSIAYILASIIIAIMMVVALGFIKKSNSAIFTITYEQTPIIRSLNQAFLSLNEANSAVSAGLVLGGIDHLNEINHFDNLFDDNILRFDAFLSALSFGTASKEFHQYKGGIVHLKWVEMGEHENFEVPKLGKEDIIVIEKTKNLFHQFVKESQKAYATKKNLLRLEIRSTPEELDKERHKLAEHARVIRQVEESVGHEMQRLIDINELRVYTNYADVTQHLSFLFKIGVGIGIFTLLLLTINMLYFRLKMVFPILKLSNIVRVIAEKGDIETNYQLDITSNDEIGSLAQSFNIMISKLKRLYTSLEDAVKIKTQELETKVDEMEKLNKLMIGREMQMIALKEENRKLSAKLAPTNPPVSSKVKPTNG